ncbi:hypothetical protein D3C71_1972800 [compost metagenome]
MAAARNTASMAGPSGIDELAQGKRFPIGGYRGAVEAEPIGPKRQVHPRPTLGVRPQA